MLVNLFMYIIVTLVIIILILILVFIFRSLAREAGSNSRRGVAEGGRSSRTGKQD